MQNENETIRLEMPMKSEYVSIIRLTTSGICNRMGFDIEAIEDVKVAVSEVCNKLISAGSNQSDRFAIEYILDCTGVQIRFCAEDSALRCIFSKEKDELGYSIISALMDDVEFCPSSMLVISMSKKLEGNQ